MLQAKEDRIAAVLEGRVLKIKIFTHSDPRQLESEINTWLMLSPNIELAQVVPVSVSSSVCATSVQVGMGGSPMFQTEYAMGVFYYG